MIALLWCLSALAAPLALTDVMEAVDARVPYLAASADKLLAAEAKLLATRGTFDPKLAVDSEAYLGKDERRKLGAKVVQQTPFGLSVEAGWRIGQGDFPPYDGYYETSAQGEAWVEVDVPVLRGLGNGPERAARSDARLGVDGAASNLDAARIEVRRKAEAAYWKWVAAGAKREVEASLLSLAESRGAALEIEVREGRRALLEQLDNERVIFERRASLAAAERDVQVAATVLSLWYRDELGQPILVPSDALPPLRVELPAGPELQSLIDRSLDRPDLRALTAQLAQTEVMAALARNQLLPQLDLGLQVRQELQASPTEVVVGADLEVPLLFRKGRGERDRAEATVSATSEALRGLRDQVAAEVRAAWIDREAATERVGWTAQGAERAASVLELQRRSWELGASDFFVLLQREELLAKANKGAIDAQLELALADTALRAAVGLE